MSPEEDDTVPVARRPVAPPPPGSELADTVLAAPDLAPRRPRRPPAPRAARPHHRIRVRPDRLIELDRPVYLGRRPTMPRVAGQLPPHLVTLPSPTGEVSATHLELREQGRAVVLTDLRSTNGTVVHVPGAAPRVLIGGESAVVSPGTVIDLGDGNLVEVLRPATAEEPA